jgi:predicted signal transduction protein with EAL and GGDEF domain
VARRIEAIDSGGLLCRLGGDEFAVLVDPAPDVDALMALADRIRGTLAPPFTMPDGAVVVSTTSIGVTRCDNPRHSVEDLYREADLALYRAKDGGRDASALFDDGLRADADARVQAERRLRAALAADGLRMYLQPVVALDGGAVVSAEALVRLEHPHEGLLMPVDFIPVAEDTGLIVEIDSRMAEHAVAHLARPDVPAGMALSINASARTLEHPEYVQRLGAALAVHGVDPRRILVEVTESSLLDATGARAQGLSAIRALGVLVGLDDFGTGYSALAYLDRFDLDFLKIDRSFVCRLGSGKRADAVVSAIIDLAHAHGLAVTAEGVETGEQAAALRAMGCDRGQGWLFGKPAPAAPPGPAGA